MERGMEKRGEQRRGEERLTSTDQVLRMSNETAVILMMMLERFHQQRQWMMDGEAAVVVQK